uniref:Uncharacterized protein n=1 Tax=Bartonella schoenbuchensis (strain DSM 13525 / NCTC 13165 / R1) TaxID=687861 RepID=E6YYH9_BARSR|nr:hypothetical protein B11C_20267 [Bartonella schoenbuchensis R1]
METKNYFTLVVFSIYERSYIFLYVLDRMKSFFRSIYLLCFSF